MTPEERKTQVAAAVRRLAEFFPKEADEKIKGLYFDRLVRSGRSAADITEVVERVIATRKQKSFPPWADLEERLADIARDQRGYQHVDLNASPRFDLSEEGKAASLATFKTFRATDMPEPEPEPKPEARSRKKRRRYQPPLTPEEIESAQRIKRARARHAEAGETNPPKDEESVPF